jgi:hypothetical protein
LFALVEATDPELLLLLESRKEDGKPVWQYAAARLTNVKLELAHQDKVVWQVETLPWSEAVDRPDKPYSAFGVR